MKRVMWAIRDNAWITKRILQDRCKHHQDYALSRFDRWFYSFKAIICIWIGREPKQVTWDMDEIDGVCCLDSGVSYPPSEPTVHWWEYVVVGHGYFSGWYAYCTSDSD